MAVTQHGGKLQLKANADLSLKRYYLVKQVTDDQTADLVTANTDVVLGSLQNKPRAGETADIANATSGETFKVQLGGTVTRGQRLMANSSGLTIAAVPSTLTVTSGVAANPTVYSFAEALQSGVTGDIIEVRGGPILV